MTIGIAAYGANAGKAILDAVAAAEAVGTGAIGGFVSAVCLADGAVVRGETQAGGIAAIRFATARTAFETATMAALISSGPHRPEPLSAFALAEPGVGVVTGHRLPNTPGADGKPMNQSVLERMASGTPTRHAVREVIESNPSADCGLAAIDAAGNGFAMQTPAALRPDSHLVCQTRNGATVCVAHNAILPHESLAALVVEIALDRMVPGLRASAEVTLARGCPVRTGTPAGLAIDGERHVREITLPDVPQRGKTVLNLGYRPRVISADRADEVLFYEPFVVAQDGMVLSIDGAETMQIATGRPA